MGVLIDLALLIMCVLSAVAGWYAHKLYAYCKRQ